MKSLPLRPAFRLNDDESQHPQTVNDERNSMRAPSGVGETLWATAAPDFAGDALAGGRIETEVAIVGAGVAGLSTAIHLRERGIDAVVLEAGRPGDGATGVSGGILAPEFPRDGIAKARRLHGREHGDRLARLVGESTACTFALIDRYRIACDTQRNGFVSPGRTAGEFDALRADGEAWRALGFDVRFLDASATAEAIGSRVYAGSLYLATGGALNPLADALGLADAARGLGAPVFVDAAVLGMDRQGDRWQLRTRDGSVTAKRVVLAANGGNANLHPKLAGNTLPLLVYEYASSPLPEEVRRRSLGRGLPYTDRQAYVFTARLDPYGRMISAIPEIIPRWTGRAFEREAMRRIRQIYALKLPAIDYMWPGTAYLSPTLLPSLVLPEDGTDLIAIQACNGRGLALNTILGNEVAALIAGEEPGSLAVPLTRPRPVPFCFLAAQLPRALLTLAQASDRWRRQPTA